MAVSIFIGFLSAFRGGWDKLCDFSRICWRDEQGARVICVWVCGQLQPQIPLPFPWLFLEGSLGYWHQRGFSVFSCRLLRRMKVFPGSLTPLTPEQPQGGVNWGHFWGSVLSEEPSDPLGLLWRCCQWDPWGSAAFSC